MMMLTPVCLSFVIAFSSLGANTVSALPALTVNETVENETVRKANEFNYTEFMSMGKDMLSCDEINELIKPYGTFGTTPGMPVETYVDAIRYQWTDSTPTVKIKRNVDIDLSRRYRYSELVQIQKDLAAKYEGVYLYKIGNSVKNRDIYALDVDLSDCAPEEKHTILLTGQVHARETAGPAYILKELIDFVKAYYAGDARTVAAAKNIRFVAVACVNPDGHDGIGFDEDNWTYSGGTLWKANANGSDINRNFPGLSWMMTAKGVKKTKYTSNSPKKIFYPGPYAGSEPETQAMMKFYQYFIGVEHAEMLIDYHQQGRVSYGGKSYATAHMNELSEDLRTLL